MVIETLQKIFKRDLEKLKQEIASYRNESNLWKVDKSIANSSGNLCRRWVCRKHHSNQRTDGWFDRTCNRHCAEHQILSR